MVNTATNGLTFDCFEKTLDIAKVEVESKEVKEGEVKDKYEFTEVDSPTKNLILRVAGSTGDTNVEIEKLDEHFEFEILLDHKYPFA
jgi:hypothetical protein